MTTKKLIHRILTSGTVGAAVLGLFAVSTRVYAAPVTFTVTNVNDAGPGSLRQAIEDANGNGNPGDQDIVRFNIPATGDQVIYPQTGLTVTQSVLIDGYTQGDAEKNTNISPEPFNGTLRVAISNYESGIGIQVSAPNVTFQGLNISNSDGGNILLDHADNFKLLGSYLDTGLNGFGRYKIPNYDNSVVITSSDNVTIGGTAAADRNILGYCIISCIQADGTSGDPTNNLRILGNYIGVGADGVASLYGETLGEQEYGAGIRLDGGVTNAIIGGTSAGAGNTLKSATFGAIYAEDVDNLTVQGNRIMRNSSRSVSCYSCESTAAGIFMGGVTNSLIGSSNPAGKNIFAGNVSDALTIGNSIATDEPSTNITVQGNNFGVMEDGTTEDPNTGRNINVKDDSNYISIKGNRIAHAHTLSTFEADGVSVVGDAQNVSILQNAIYHNDNMGIELGGGGPWPNDDTDSDTGPNGFLNYPTYYQITETGGNTKIDYRYKGAPGNYRIEFFSNTEADSPGPGEGETYLGFANVTSDGSGDQPLTHTVTGTGHTNITLTATLIDPDSPSGFGPTSQFGASGPAANPPSDLAITKDLLNPEAMTVGGMVQYEVTITNDGPYPIDIGYWSGSTPTSNDLFTDILPPQLAYASSSGTNISCTGGGPGSVGTYLSSYYPNHTGYELVLCGYTGGTHMLNAGSSVSVVITAEVLDAKNITATNFVIGPLANGDPDRAAVVDIFASGEDVIDEFMDSPNNNFAYARPSADLDVTKELTNPEDATVGGILNYDITVTNNGADAVNLATFDGTTLPEIQYVFMLDALPPQFEYQGVSGFNMITCATRGAVSGLGPGGVDHPNHEVIICGITDDYVLAAGDSIVITLSAEVMDAKNVTATNYVIGPGAATDSDVSILGAAFSSGQDVFTYLMTHPTGNFAYARPETDLVVNKRLLNSEDLALGAQLNYEISLTNAGADAINLANFDASGPTNSIFADIMPPMLTLVGATSGPVSCTSLSPVTAGMAFGPAMANHASYYPVLCGFTGGDYILEAGQTLTAVVTMEVNDDSNLDFTNYVLGPTFPGEATYAKFGQVFGSGDDAIDVMSVNPNNNFALAFSKVSDLELTKVLDDPEAVADQADIHYTLTLTNAGPYPADITALVGNIPIQTDMIIDVLPGNLTFVSSSNPNLPCTVIAPASALPFFATHGSYTAISCHRSGGSTQIASGESISTTITAKVTGAIGSGFSNFAIPIVSGVVPGDPDGYPIRRAFAWAAIHSGDVIDLLNASVGDDGIVAAAYTVPGGGDDNNGGGGSNSGSSGGSGPLGALGETGQRLLVPVGLPLLVLALSLLAIRYFRRKSYRVQ